MASFSELDPAPIRATIERVVRGIEERFPGSGLLGVARELERTADENAALVARLRRPIWWLRALSVLGALTLLGLVAWATWEIARLARLENALSDILQGIDAAANELIFLSIALFFLVSLEARFKRGRALRMLHRLRSLAHVVDMHQLTKDPAQGPSPGLTREQLILYLDACSGLLALISKLAALHAQHLQDGVVLEAVGEIESLSSDLTRKVWQKITILSVDRAGAVYRSASSA